MGEVILKQKSKTLRKVQVGMVGQTSLLLMAVGLVVGVALINILFLRLTRLQNPVEEKPLPALIRLVRPLAFFIAEAFIVVFTLIIIFFLVIRQPDNPITAAFPNVNAEAVDTFMEQPAEGAGFFVLLFLFLAGMPCSVWLILTISRRLDNKTWEDPGNIVSRVMRFFAYCLSMYAFPLIALGLIAAIVIYDKRLPGYIESIPNIIARLQQGELDEDQLGALAWIGFTLVVWVIFALLSVRQVIFGIRTLGWPSAEGKISSAKIATSHSTRGNVTYYFSGQCQYTADGKQGKAPIDSTDNAGFRSTYKNHPYAWKMRKQYPVGTEVTVRYNPNNLKEAVLSPGVDLFSIVSTLLLVTAFVLVFFAAGFPSV